MTDFLLELRSEEIPARMQARAREDLSKLFAAELAKFGLTATETQTYTTPRRLALIARGLPDATQAVSEELKGPKAAAPPQALEGFLRKTGLTRDQLTERDGILYAITERPGRATAEVLAEAIPGIIRAFPWPKSMRWGAASTTTESLKWVRPLQGIVALFGDEIVPIKELAWLRILKDASGNLQKEIVDSKIVAGRTTVGHRFHHPGVITIGNAADYAEKLRACHVIVDQDERQSIIALGAQMAAAKAGLTLVRDEGLLIENAGLTEWPVPLLGRFDPEFLTVPPEVIQLTARVNQKYFVCNDADGNLANAFICTANIDATDGGATIVEGNRKVLAARLSDARFFYDTDLKVPLEEQAKRLEKIVFHEKLGTVADKVDRVAKLARWLVEEGIVPSSPLPSGEGQGASAPRGEGRDAAQGTALTLPLGSAERAPPSPDGRGELAALAERAARLCKADLVTGMVGEFPELQGLMGGYYATAQNEDPRIAAAIRDHYKPVGQGDDVPTAPVTVAVSLADKLDTLFGFFAINQRPSGSRDPFALRRATIAIIALLERGHVRLNLRPALEIFYRSQADNPPHHGIGGGAFYLGAAGDELASTDFGSIAVFIEEVEGIARGQQREMFIHRAVDFDASEAWRDYELAFTDENPKMGVPVEAYAGVFALMPFNVVGEKVLEFFADRLKVQQREAGVRHDLIDAVFALGGENDLVRLLARVRALQAFVGTADGANLLAGYKRAANILKKEGYPSSPLPSGEGQGASAPRGEGRVQPGEQPSPSHPAAPGGPLPLPTGEGISLSYTPEKAETDLITALDAAEPAAASAVAAEDFAAAMTALATLRAPIDAFFETVTVNDPDPEKRAARLALLARVRAAVHNVADFSKIDG